MNYASIVRILSIIGLIVSGALIPPILAAALLGETPQLVSFSVTAVLVALVAGSVLLLTPKPKRRARPSDGLALVLIGWVAVSVMAAPPFVLGVANTSISAALQEAVSCLTTTGHSVIEIGDGGWPISLIVWRGMLHMLGAIATLVMAASVFAALNLGGPGIHRTTLFTIPETSFFDAVPRVVRAAAIIVFGLIGIIYVALIVTGYPPGKALIDAMSVITTGLVEPCAIPRPASLFDDAILSLGLVMGTIGVAVILELQRGKFFAAIYDPELIAFALCMLGFASVALVAGLNLFEAGGWALSALSTSGLAMDGGQSGRLPVSVLVLPAIIGGAALSTAGGVKLGRLVILARRAAQEFSRLGYRGSIVRLKYRGRTLEESSVIGVWVYLIGYVVVLVGLLGLLSFQGLDFSASIQTAVGALSNSGSLVTNTDATAGMNFTMIVGMLLGRWEILALIPALTPAFWLR